MERRLEPRVERRSRARVASDADRHASELAGKLGSALRDARRRLGLTQTQAGNRAGIDQTTWSRLERDRDAGYTLATWDRAAHAVGTALSAYLPQASLAAQPRDAVHLRNQEMLLRTTRPGGWMGLAEEAFDRNVARSRFADVLLERRAASRVGREYALLEVIDWFDDVGAPSRDWQRRLDAVERYAIARMKPGEALPRVSGCWVLRATRRNRQLVGEHGAFFRSRFAGSGRAWIAALTDKTVAMPAESALLWVDVQGTRIFAAKLGGYAETKDE
jgi:transcriptional regulator with XRE-family HTH domain